MPTALTPSASMSLTAAASASAPRAESATLHPSLARAVAMAYPMPWLDPEIAAFFPFRPRSMRLLLFSIVDALDEGAHFYRRPYARLEERIVALKSLDMSAIGGIDHEKASDGLLPIVGR